MVLIKPKYYPHHRVVMLNDKNIDSLCPHIISCSHGGKCIELGNAL